MPSEQPVRIETRVAQLPEDVHAKLVAIAGADSIEELAAHFRCGFELETMRSLGRTYSDFTNEFHEWQISHRYSRDEVMRVLCDPSSVFPTNVLARVLNRSWATTAFLDLASGTARRALMADLLGTSTPPRETLEPIVDTLGIGAVARELVDDNNVLNVQEDMCIPLEQWLVQHKLGGDYTLLEGGRDSTVTGPEWRTRGGLTREQFMSVVTQLLNHPHLVTEGCSFHVHLSVAGLTSEYNANTQRAMTEYILAQPNIPARVRARWNSAARSNFNLGAVPSKYAFAAFNGEHGTWEFRCWGNIDSIEDAAYALTQSMRAYQYQARCYLRGGVTVTSDATIRQHGSAVLSGGTPLSLEPAATDAANTEF